MTPPDPLSLSSVAASSSSATFGVQLLVATEMGQPLLDSRFDRIRLDQTRSDHFFSDLGEGGDWREPLPAGHLPSTICPASPLADPYAAELPPNASICLDA
ncbi:hypothetical protein CRG98_004853 [Punica granatum]|uniref:Uncharacterized protein n=1 Tax=Punica granatum TaxID=22663 RepID=A0A2I0L215_PUNGR|nr:hypothetical protein CRG98_004853 [Punica granatum]